MCNTQCWFQTFTVFWMLYAFFWVIPRHLNFICQCFGTLSVHLHRQVGVKNELHLRNVGVFIRENVWLEPNLFPYKYTNISQTQFILHTYLPMKMEQTECSETLVYKIQTPGNYLEESIQQNIFAFLFTWHMFYQYSGILLHICMSVFALGNCRKWCSLFWRWSLLDGSSWSARVRRGRWSWLPNSSEEEYQGDI